MKHFIIWPVLVPALAFCHDETSTTATISPQGIELDVQGSNESESKLHGGSWNTTDFDNFLQQPLPPQSVTTDGTITEYDGDDLYGDYPYNNL